MLGFKVLSVLINSGSMLIHNLLKIPNEQYIKRTSNNLNPTSMESHIFVINLLQQGFKRWSRRYITESTKWKKKERTEQRGYGVTVITCSLLMLREKLMKSRVTVSLWPQCQWAPRTTSLRPATTNPPAGHLHCMSDGRTWGRKRRLHHGLLQREESVKPLFATG